MTNSIRNLLCYSTDSFTPGSWYQRGYAADDDVLTKMTDSVVRCLPVRTWLLQSPPSSRQRSLHQCMGQGRQAVRVRCQLFRACESIHLHDYLYRLLMPFESALVPTTIQPSRLLHYACRSTGIHLPMRYFSNTSTRLFNTVSRCITWSRNVGMIGYRPHSSNPTRQIRDPINHHRHHPTCSSVHDIAVLFTKRLRPVFANDELYTIWFHTIQSKLSQRVQHLGVYDLLYILQQYSTPPTL